MRGQKHVHAREFTHLSLRMDIYCAISLRLQTSPPAHLTGLVRQQRFTRLGRVHGNVRDFSAPSHWPFPTTMMKQQRQQRIVRFHYSRQRDRLCTKRADIDDDDVDGDENCRVVVPRSVADG